MMRTIAHLTTSRQLGGPEKQILGLARTLRASHRTVLASFAEAGRCGAFLNEAARWEFETHRVPHDTPYLSAMLADVEGWLRTARADVLCCHGYKANVVGLTAAWRAGVPAVAVFRGWTAEDFKVRCYEALDALCFRHAPRVVCVAHRQVGLLRHLGVHPSRIAVIPNAVDSARFSAAPAGARRRLSAMLPGRSLLLGAAGRLVREKGFLDLLQIMRVASVEQPNLGLIILGEGPLSAELARTITRYRLVEHVALAGFRSDLHALLPGFDLFVHPSHREGMPNIVLEAAAAGLPVVATDAGGTRQIVRHGWNGLLAAPGDVRSLRQHLHELTRNAAKRQLFGARARRLVEQQFGFARQGRDYTALFDTLLDSARRPWSDGTTWRANPRAA